MISPQIRPLSVATLIVAVLAALSGCQHSFSSRGEISPTLPQWSSPPPAAQPAVATPPRVEPERAEPEK